MTDEANEQAQWGAIDELRQHLSDVKQRTASAERAIKNIEERMDRQREAILQGRAQAHAEYETLMATLKETNDQLSKQGREISEARGGLRVGRWLVGILAAFGVLKAGDWTGFWQALIEAIKGG